MKLDAFVDIIKQGGLVAFPTETVYGLGADAGNLDAIQKVFTTKGRPQDNPLIVHISDRDQLSDFVTEIPQVATKLMDAFWPGPLTLVFKKKDSVLDIISAGLETVAIRMPNKDLALELIHETGPLVAPSANLSGKPSPTRASHVIEDFGTDFPMIDGGATQIGLESTVLDVTSEPLLIYRPGHITKVQIEDATDIKALYVEHSVDKPSPSPGVRYSHYSPRALVGWWDGETVEEDTLYLVLSSKKQASNIKLFDSLDELASNLYDQFRQADHDGYKSIKIEQFENYPALINRIQKAIE